MRIATPAASALRNEKAFFGFREVMQNFAGAVVMNHGSDGDFDLEVLAVAASLVAALAVLSAVRPKEMIEAEFEKRVFLWIGNQEDAAAVAAIAAARPAPGHKLLAPERDTAMTAVAGLHRDFGFVNEHER
jgi:hypothetical protein